MTNQTGQLYTHLYCERTDPTLDDPVLRGRLGAYVQTKLQSDHSELRVHLGVEAGLKVPMIGVYHEYEKFMQARTTLELLNCITHVWRFLYKKHSAFRGPNDAAQKLEPCRDFRRPFCVGHSTGV